jgi:hypothetical protein
MNITVKRVCKIVTRSLKARTDVAIAWQQHSKHISTATDTDTTTEDTIFSMQSVMRLYKENQMDKPASRQLAVLGCIARSHYLARTSEQTEDFMCVVVIVIYRVSYREIDTVIVICSYELQAFNKSNYKSKPRV